LNVEPPKADERGICSFFFADGLAVEVSSAPSGSARLSGLVGKAPEDSQEAERFYKSLLQLNLGRLRSVRPSLSVNPHTGSVELGRDVPSEIRGQDEVEAVLEDFLNELEFWKGQVIEKTDEAPPLMMPFLR